MYKTFSSLTTLASIFLMALLSIPFGNLASAAVFPDRIFGENIKFSKIDIDTNPSSMIPAQFIPDEPSDQESGGNFYRYENAFLGIAMDYPTTWNIDEQEIENGMVLFLSNQPYSMGVGVSLTTLPESSLTLRNIAEAVTENLDPGVRVIELKGAQLANNPAFYLVTNNPEEQIAQMSVVTILNEIEYSINFVTGTENFNNNLPIFQQMLNSFQFVTSNTQGQIDDEFSSQPVLDEPTYDLIPGGEGSNVGENITVKQEPESGP